MAQSDVILSLSSIMLACVVTVAAVVDGGVAETLGHESATSVHIKLSQLSFISS